MKCLDDGSPGDYKESTQIEIKARGLSSNIFAGQYHTAFKGRGMAFSEVRDYQFGDDVRDIDWNVTARFHRPYVKVFEEERELTVMLLIDVSGSLDFGTRRQMKRDMVTEIAATLAFSAIQNNDKTGVIFFSDKIEKYIPPKKGRRHILYIIREMLDFKGESRRTDINVALQFLSSVIKRRCTAFVLSDFYVRDSFSQSLTICNRKHDIAAIQVYDPFAKELPDVGLLKVVDAETGFEQYIDDGQQAPAPGPPPVLAQPPGHASGCVQQEQRRQHINIYRRRFRQVAAAALQEARLTALVVAPSWLP